MMRGMILAAGLLSAAAASGCFVDAQAGYNANYDAEVTGPAPDMVEVSPGVQVVADYDEPVFYNDGFYWRYYNNIWYRSGNYANGWAFYANPPVAVLRIDRPYAYAHYRPVGYVARSRPRYRAAPVREYRGPAPAYRRAEPARREEVRGGERREEVRGGERREERPAPRREERPAPKREERPAPKREEHHDDHH